MKGKRQGWSAERRAAKILNGRLEPASGATFRTNDVRTSRFSIEVKERQRSIQLTEEMIDTVYRKAIKVGRRPAFYLRIGKYELLAVLVDDVVVNDDGTLTVG